MKYVKAYEVLPEDIIEVIQNYIDGEYLYIPRKTENEKSWGEKSGAKKMLKERNSQILRKYNKGIKVTQLAKEYFLSEQSIRRIISKEKRENLLQSG